MTRGWRRLGRVGEEGWEQVGGHKRVGVGEEGGGFGEDRRLVGRLGVERGGLEGEGGPHLPPIAVGVEGGSCTPAPQLVVGAEEQGEMRLAVHGGEVVGGHSTSAIMADCF